MSFLKLLIATSICFICASCKKGVDEVENQYSYKDGTISVWGSDKNGYLVSATSEDSTFYYKYSDLASDTTEMKVKAEESYINTFTASNN